jgi:hypothetical protein
MKTNIYKLQRAYNALQLLVNYLEADPTLYDGDDDGSLNRVMCNAHGVLNMFRNDDQATCVHCDESHDLDADHQCKGGE